MWPLLLSHHFSTLLWLAEESTLVDGCASREEGERRKNGREASSILYGLHIIIKGWNGMLEMPSPTPPLKYVPHIRLHRKASRKVLNI